MLLDAKELAFVLKHINKKTLSDYKLESFLRESNWIEKERTKTGRGRINPGDRKAIRYLNDLNGKKLTLENILELHKIIGEYLNKDWVGKLRTMNVSVWNSSCPHYQEVPQLMEDFIKVLPYLNSYWAHIVFEKIHPFRDLNGRTGRFIWLYKRDMYFSPDSFLQAYYYDSLWNLPLKKPKRLPSSLKKLIF